MRQEGWKYRVDAPRVTTEPQLFQRSREKRQKIQESMKRFTSNDWNKQVLSPPTPQKQPILPPRSPKRVEFAMDTLPLKESQSHNNSAVGPNESEEININDTTNNNGQRIDYSLSMKLSESGVGNRSKRDIDVKNILDEEFYDLKESRMLSQSGEQNRPKFPFVANSQEVVSVEEEKGEKEREEVEKEKETINYEISSPADVNLEELKETILEAKQQQQPQCPAQSHFIEQDRQHPNTSKNKELDEIYKQTIKPSQTNPMYLPIQEKQQVSPQQPNQRSELQQQQQQPQETLQPKSNQPQPNASHHSQSQDKNLENSSGKFFFTSQFKQYMENKSNDQQEEAPIHLNQTVKSSILDKVFNEDIRASEYMDDDLGLDNIRRNEAANKLANLFELSYEKTVTGMLDDLTCTLNFIPKFKKFQAKRDLRDLSLFFSHIKLYQQYKHWKKTLALQADEFKDNQAKRRLENCFTEWKIESLGDYYNNCTKVKVYRSVKERQAKHSIFKGWKMMLFHNKIEREAVKFRMGTLFRGWVEVSKERRQQNKKAALTFYYINLMARVFNYWRGGIQNIREENERKHLARSFNKRRLARLAWNSWVRFVEEQEEMNGEDYIPVQIVVERKFLKNQ